MTVQAALRDMDARSWLEYLTEMRRRDRRPRSPRIELTSVMMFDREDPGHPLGRGMPPGRTMRKDGETHRQAWMRVVRADPCAYCGRLPRDTAVAPGVQPPCGTVDHIEPQSRPCRGIGGVHTWLNFTGACGRCNSRKGANSLLMFLAARRGCPVPLNRHVRE